MNRLRKVTNQISCSDDEKYSCDTNQEVTCNSSCSKPVKVVVTGAAGNIAYSILFGIGAGLLLGPNQRIELRLLDIPIMLKKLEGVAMELNDCAFPLLSSIICTADYKTAFENVEIALLIGAKPRGKGMQRADLLKENAQIFEGQGKAIDKYADKNIKVCVVGNPANTNALIAMTNAPSIPKENFTAMTRLDQNRAAHQIASRLKIDVSNVKNIIIWGNHSKTQYPDVNYAFISDFPRKNFKTSVRSAISDEKWLRNDFINVVQDRGAAIIDARGLSSAASAAMACLDHVRDWILGTREGEWVSMGVISDGSYGVEKGIIFSFPVICNNGNYKIVEGLPIDEFSKQKLEITEKELVEEKQTALGK